MAVIRPFKGIRFNREKVNDPGRVITPPYDVIDRPEQERLHQLSPYNIIRLEYGKIYPDDNEIENRYSRAAETLNLWLKNEILKPDSRKSYYLYEQRYTYNRQEFKRRGVVAALKLQPYSDHVILRHERTMAAPKADRLELLTRTRTNISPIFTLMPDPENRIKDYFAIIEEYKPLVDLGADSGMGHRLWNITDQAIQEELTAYLSPQPLLIADGHHRYETALNFYQNSDHGKTPGAGYILSIMVCMNDPGLLVLPTHRLVSGLDREQKENLFNAVKNNFKMVERGSPGELNRGKYLGELASLSREKCGLGFITGEQSYLLIPEGESCGETLPVSLLHERLLKPVLSPGAGGEADKDLISFPHDIETVLKAVVSGSADAAFILETIRAPEVLDRAGKGLVMPQKSTFFYPKLPGGLVLYNMDLSW